MNVEALTIRKFEPETAPEKEWDQLVGLILDFISENKPGDLVPPAEVIRKQIEISEELETRETKAWLAYSPDNELVAYISLFYVTPENDDYESKKDYAGFNLYVVPEYRRQGLGTTLLNKLATEAAERGKRHMESWVANASGDAFMEKMGAEVALQMKTNRLYLADVDWVMVEQWVAEGAAKNPDTTLHQLEGLPPDDVLPAFADLLMHIFSQMPKENASGFPEMITPDMIHERMQMMEKQNMTNHLLYTEEPDGSLSAMTDTIYNPQMPHEVDQGLTGVHLDARGRGLGKWLKAKMLLEIRDRYPDVNYIDTANANVNAAMIYINEKVGFKFHKQNTTYKVMVADIVD